MHEENMDLQRHKLTRNEPVKGGQVPVANKCTVVLPLAVRVIINTVKNFKNLQFSLRWKLECGTCTSN